jgi:hypothetical protein
VSPPGPDQQISRAVGMRSDSSSSIVSIIYLVIGLIVASGHAYFTNLNQVMPILSAVLAVLLWPLVLLGVDLHLK